MGSEDELTEEQLELLNQFVGCKKITQRELKEKTGYSQPYIQHLLKGIRRISPEIRAKFYVALGLPPELKFLINPDAPLVEIDEKSFQMADFYASRIRGIYVSQEGQGGTEFLRNLEKLLTDYSKIS
jgi:transcriptional regulator with XRE-family HTH domain